MTTSAMGNGASAIAKSSIDSLLAAFPKESNPEIIIRHLAREKVAKAKSMQWEGPPFCPREFTSFFGIKCKAVDHDIDGDGRILLCQKKQIRIEYRSKSLPERQRFTIFHEFAHTLFPNYCEFLPLHQSPQKKVPDLVKKFERLCDLGAAEMLLPLEDFTKDFQKLRWLGFESIHKLRERYHASIDATIYRLADLVNTVGFAAVFLTDQKGINTGYGPLWVKYSSRNSLFKSYIPSGIAPPNNSVVTRCYRNNLEITEAVKETWWINGSPRTWLVQAAKLPTISENIHYPKVVALFFPTGYGKSGSS